MTQQEFNNMMNVYLQQLALQDPSQWSMNARNWAESSGIIQGDENGNKMYRKFVTREELAEVLRKFDNVIKS